MLSCISIFALNGARSELMEFDQAYTLYKLQQRGVCKQPLSMLMWAVAQGHVVGTQYALTQAPKLKTKETVPSRLLLTMQPVTPREFAKKVRHVLTQESPLYNQFCDICAQLRHAEEKEQNPTFVQKKLPPRPKPQPETEFMFGEDDMDWGF